MRLLSALLDILFPLRDTERIVRETSLDVLRSLTRLRERNGCITLLPYRHPLVRAFILEAKFRGSGTAQRLLGQVLGSYLKGDQVVLLPIPLGARRLRERGYNQVEEIAKASGVPMDTNILRRVRETPPQTEQSERNRRKNVTGAFIASSIDPATSYFILDDVLTTGATLHDAYRALTEAGATNVRMVALAH